VMPVVQNLANHLKDAGIRVKLDDDDTKRPGWKFAEWELKGVPVRIVLGARDLENRVLEIARRDTKEKASVPMEGSLTYVQNLLAEIQQNLFARAAATRTANTHHVNTYDEMKAVLAGDGTAETAEKIKEETKATIRCMPMGVPDEAGVCVYSGKPSARRVIFAKAY
jgi:prolyl-tRNA synthetase